MKSVVKKRKLSKLEKNEIVTKYNKLVKKIAYGYAQKSTDPCEDLIQVGLIALLEAAENFNEEFRTGFKTYAIHYISGHIRHYLRDKQNLMKGPCSLQELSYKISQVSKTLTQKLGREPSQEELSKELEVTPSRIDEAKSYEKKISIIWLDQTKSYDNDDEGNTLLEYLFDPKTSTGINDEIEDKIILKEAIKRLDPRIRNLLELRYYNGLTQLEISNILGLSQMEVCRKLKKAEKMLRNLIY